MLVLRKEIKIGLAAGAAVAGIALVYGVMSTLSASSKTPAAPSPDSAVASNDAAPNESQSGLPPVDDAGKSASGAKTADPYLESARSDGNKTDPWTQALQTGRVAVDVQPVSRSLINTPAGSTANSSDSTLAAGKGPIVTQIPTDPITNPSNTSAGTTTEKLASNDSGKSSAGVAAAGTYKVEPGDTFSKIAEKLYGDKRMADVIQKANPNIQPTRLRVGATINVPAKESSEVATIRGEVRKSTARVTGAIDSSKEYRVVSGDTLNRIAVKLYGRRAMWEAIYDENKAAIGSNPAHLKVGQVLKLPKTPTATTASR